MEFTLKNIWDLLSKAIVFILVVSIVFGVGAFVYNSYFVSPVYSTDVGHAVQDIEELSDTRGGHFHHRAGKDAFVIEMCHQMKFPLSSTSGAP